VTPGLVVLVAFAVTGCSHHASRKDGAISKAGDVSVFDVQVGDCLNPGDKIGAEISQIKAVPCKDPHTHEVFGVPKYPGTSDVYPGDDKLKEFANAQCLQAFGAYTGTDYLDSKLFFSYLQPSIRSWNDGKDRTVICVIVATGKPVTGSVRVAGATTGGATTDQNKAARTGEHKVETEIQDKARKATGLSN
jgi:putative regulator of septum formation